MADESDILLHMIQEQWAQARQSENQRSTISNFTIVIALAAFGFLAKTTPGRKAIPLTIFLTVLGVFGALICAKFYERFYLHIQRVGRMMERLDQLHPEAQLCRLEQRADDMHNQRFPLTIHLRLHHLWMTIHIAIALIGAICTILVIVRGRLL